MKKIYAFVLAAPQNLKLKRALNLLGLLGLANSQYSLVMKLVERLSPSLDRGASPIYFLGERLPSKNEWDRGLDVLQGHSHLLNQFIHELDDFKPSEKLQVLDSPIVTVLVSLYKSDPHLELFLQNVEAQTLFSKSEIVIEVAAASKFETMALSKFAANHSNVSVTFHAERVGIYSCWNLAVAKSSAPFITNMNCDDLRHPLSLEVQASKLLDEDVDVVYQDVFYTYQAGLGWEDVVRMGLKSSLPHVTSRLLISGMNPPHNAPMWRRELHDGVGTFDENFESAGDHDFWIRCSLAGAKFSKIDFSTVSYFINPEGMSTRDNSPGKLEGLRIMNKYKKTINARF